MATITSKGQVTLPKKVRDALGLEAGCEVEFELEGGKAFLRKRVPRRVFDRWRGFLREAANTTRTDDVMGELRDK